ncbi:MAG TPA: hypothetical protein VFG20_13255 [Planctomycetaceae bacterium]|nr:hypothetical protein [Planctomycetaceae bacterium]
MSDVNSLIERINAEFAATDDRLKTQQTQLVQEYQGRQERLAKLQQVFEQLRDVWTPRLRALAEKFGDKVQVAPHVTPSLREATFKFKSALAHIELRFSAAADNEVRNVILSYDLDILPILMKFDSHAELAFPLDQVDSQKAGAWIDDRIVSFVKTYLSMHENNYYLKDSIVSDPIANVSFPKFAAGATVEWNGKTHYFIGEETRCEFERQNGISKT